MPSLPDLSVRVPVSRAPGRPARARVLTALAVALAATSLAGCLGRHKGPKVDLAYQERPVELLYATGAAKLDRRQWNDAVSYFDEVERQHPYSEWARRSILMEAFAYYQADKYEDAISAADRFISLYPGMPSTSYAYYLKAQCWFEQISDVGRDQAATEQALAALEEVRRRFPASEYAQDAKLKVDMVQDQLAGKEMAIGRWYEKESQPVSAIGRFKTVVDRYQTTSHTPEALYRMVEVNLNLGLTDQAERDGAVLGYNFPGDPWYAEAYALLKSKGLKPLVEPKSRRAGLFGRRPRVDPKAAAKPAATPVVTKAAAAPAAPAADSGDKSKS